MKKRYRIGRSDVPHISSSEIMRYKDMGRLLYNYQRATRPLYRRPLYKDPKAFLALLLILLLVWLLSATS